MHRLFVGLRPPTAVRDRLSALMSGVAGARWQHDDQLHITLRYIGEVDTPIAEDVVAALSAIRAEPVTVALAGVGAFDTRGRIDTYGPDWPRATRWRRCTARWTPRSSAPDWRPKSAPTDRMSRWRG